MLPNLHDSQGNRLQLLVPVTIEPAWASARRRSLLELKKVVSVRVSGSSGKGWKAPFTVEVFTESHDGYTPSNDNRSANSSSTSTPAVQTKRTLAEFADMRQAVLAAVRLAHPGEPCDFCAEVLEYVVLTSVDPDSLSLRLLGDQRAKRKLTTLLNDLLRLTVRHSTAEGRNICSGQAHVPRIVHDFFFDPTPQTSESDE